MFPNFLYHKTPNFVFLQPRHFFWVEEITIYFHWSSQWNETCWIFPQHTEIEQKCSMCFIRTRYNKKITITNGYFTKPTGRASLMEKENQAKCWASSFISLRYQHCSEIFCLTICFRAFTETSGRQVKLHLSNGRKSLHSGTIYGALLLKRNIGMWLIVISLSICLPIWLQFTYEEITYKQVQIGVLC